MKFLSHSSPKKFLNAFPLVLFKMKCREYFLTCTGICHFALKRGYFIFLNAIIEVLIQLQTEVMVSKKKENNLYFLPVMFNLANEFYLYQIWSISHANRLLTGGVY